MTSNNGPLLYAVVVVVIASVWRRRKGRGGDREKESVREMVVAREDARERPASGPDRYDTRHERGKSV